MARKGLVRLVMVGLVASMAAIPASGVEVAKINGKSFTDADFRKALQALGRQGEMVKSNPSYRKRFLDHVIDSQLMASEARKTKMDQTPEFKARLESASRDILATIYMEQELEKGLSDKALKTHFDKNKDRYSSEEIRASHILIKEKDKELAETVLKKAQEKGADFAELAKKHSTGPSGPNGGDLNFFGRGRMVPPFEKAAFATEKGKVHPQLVKTRFGYHIIKVTDKKGGKETKFDEKKDEIKRQLSGEVRQNILKGLRDKAGVTIDEKALNGITL